MGGKVAGGWFVFRKGRTGPPGRCSEGEKKGDIFWRSQTLLIQIEMSSGELHVRYMQQSELFKWPRGHYIIEESLSGRCQSLSTSRCRNVARELWQEESLQAHTCKLSSCSGERGGQRV